jgi:hypothetical protein
MEIAEDRSVVDIAIGWDLHVDVSPDWLFFVLCSSGSRVDPTPSVAEAVWQIGETHGVYRFVFEIGNDVIMSSHMIGQLVLLHKRCHKSGGMMRICGFSEANHQLLQMMHLGGRFPNYRTREDAVMGRPP